MPQPRIEQVLAEWAGELGAEIRRGHEVSCADGATSTAPRSKAPQGTLRCRYLVACDGERSTVRALTGADFPGMAARHELLRADVAGIRIQNRRFERLANGLAIAARRPDGVTRVMVHEFGRPALARSGPPEFAEVTDTWKRVTGEDISHGEPLWVNAFDDTRRQLTSYRHGRVLFAGDAAHQQMPTGGQALNLGMQDAANLGWKLALVVGGRAGDELLDTYHAERHAVGRRVLSNIGAQASLLLGGPEVSPVRELLTELLSHGKVRERLAGTVSGLSIDYDVGDQHPLAGRRLSHLVTGDGTSAAALLRDGRGLLLDTGTQPGPPAAMVTPWTDRVRTVRATAARDAPGGVTVLVRPDGYVAWAGSDGTGLRDALRRWFGPAA